MCDVMPGMDVDKVDVTVVGGHAGTTIMPLLSQVRGRLRLFPVSVVIHSCFSFMLQNVSMHAMFPFIPGSFSSLLRR